MRDDHAFAVLRPILLRIRLLAALATGVMSFFLLPTAIASTTRGLIAWNLGIVSYMVLVGFMMARATRQSMRARAKALDEGHYTVLILSVVAALASLATIVFELFGLRTAPGPVAALHIGLSISTIVTSWSFVHLIFSEHYAHAFYVLDDAVEDDADDIETRRKKGLHFPGQPWPDYVDFLYFSFTIGVANQTADTEIMSRSMRVLVLVHSVISYFFNTIILALTINIAAGMLGG